MEYYRRELEQRRDHLRSTWLWNGPLVLACLILAGIVGGRAFAGLERFRSSLPLIALLVIWTAYGLWRRRRQAGELQREIDEMRE